MQIEIPKPQVRANGVYAVLVTKGYGDPRGTIALDDKWEVVLNNVSVEDCDGLIKAAAKIKDQVLAYRAELAIPHGRKHMYKGRCQLCGKPEDDELHAPPVITCSERTCDAKHPETGDWCVIEGPHAEHRDTYGQTWPNHGYAATSEAEAAALLAGEGGVLFGPFDDEAAAAVLADSIATGTPVLVTEDEALPSPRPAARCKCGHIALNHHLNQVVGELQYCNECSGTDDCAVFSPAEPATSVTA